MRVVLKLRKGDMEPSAYDIDIPLEFWVPIPTIGRRFFFSHMGEPMFMVINDITYELTCNSYEITLWGSYHLNVEGQRGVDL